MCGEGEVWCDVWGGGVWCGCGVVLVGGVVGVTCSPIDLPSIVSTDRPDQPTQSPPELLQRIESN